MINCTNVPMSLSDLVLSLRCFLDGLFQINIVGILSIKTLAYITVRGRKDFGALIRVIFKILIVESKQIFCLN